MYEFTMKMFLKYYLFTKNDRAWIIMPVKDYIIILNIKLIQNTNSNAPY